MGKNNNKIFWIISIILSFFILDKILKKIFLLKIIDYKFGLIHFVCQESKNLFFGFVSFNLFFAILISFLIFYLISIFYKYLIRREYLNCFATGMIIGGALSNFYDRIFYGFVIDYVDFGSWSFFNLADAMIFIGVIIVVVKFFKER